ncbi:MAG: alpha/beta fold hydrolase [Haliangiales bacterium]
MFCFPFAGGGASVFRDWGRQVPPWLEVQALVLPGRELRLRERPFTRLPALVEAIADGIRHLDELPFVFFGHSMGAFLCFELGRYLRRQGMRLPRALFVSAAEAPQLRQVRQKTYALGDEEFLDVLRRYNGTPRVVLESRDYMELMLPTIRADFELVQTYQHEREPPLPIDIMAFGGRDDQSVSLDALEGWREHTSGAFELRTFPGDHFFIHSQGDQVLACIHELLVASRAPRRERNAR